ncbi:hypothetical protein [Burkholderia stagnalis]|uniref:Uncharacterized protein n=1 Tax=Burkholderia stagnalis TaxID=1503054 RepID=A0A119RR23_9BURK|nr:hypothetical protein [Burkholderia stagnalis]KVZ03373.1 hypothetical protein WT35_28180 [Burkholderia stagnalis]KWA48380.1 hypothetical protein WT43_32490 [Burkholderia stagnalis]KWA51707.1 hypothetical protein WT42_16650 [Burkholderia stagnalis]KWA62688.1 hypothetical protein WT44_13750 [Burkholderia stagnalis]KWC98327.1 hypothetical protein WT46_23735 [Burkholderia stagnalis]
MNRINLGDYAPAQFERGIPGLIVDNNTAAIRNGTNRGTAPIEFGRAVFDTDIGGEYVLPGDARAKAFAGISIRHVTFTANLEGEVFYKPDVTLPALEFGRIWATCKDGCNPRDPVKFTGDGVLATRAGTRIAGAEWETKTEPGQVGIVVINRVPGLTAPVAAP